MSEKTRGSKKGSKKNHEKGVGTLTVNNGKTNVEIDYTDVARLMLVLRALNNGKRQQLLEYIEENGGKVTVTDIFIKLRCEQSVASQHLAILREAGLVKDDHIGKFHYYRTIPAAFANVQKAIEVVG